MVDLVQWLTAQLDEDERIARRATVRQAGGEFWTYDDESGVQAKSGLGVARRAVPVHGEHIARHDPARVLREIDAKRKLVRWHYRRPGPKWTTPGAEGFECATCDQQFPCLTLRLLTTVYRDRPGYREEWAP